MCVNKCVHANIQVCVYVSPYFEIILLLLLGIDAGVYTCMSVCMCVRVCVHACSYFKIILLLLFLDPLEGLLLRGSMQACMHA